MKFISDYIVPIGPEGLHIIQTGKWRTRKPVCTSLARKWRMGFTSPTRHWPWLATQA